jgi:hypothetical protein
MPDASRAGRLLHLVHHGQPNYQPLARTRARIGLGGLVCLAAADAGTHLVDRTCRSVVARRAFPGGAVRPGS